TPRLGRIDTTGHLTDNLSYSFGAHALKFGAKSAARGWMFSTTANSAAPSMRSTAPPDLGLATRISAHYSCHSLISSGVISRQPPLPPRLEIPSGTTTRTPSSGGRRTTGRLRRG